VKMSEDEISIEEFMSLSEEAPARGKVSEEALLAELTGKAVTCSVLAKKFGVSYSAMHSKLKRLLEAGKVQRRYKEGTAFWTAAQ